MYQVVKLKLNMTLNKTVNVTSTSLYDNAKMAKRRHESGGNERLLTLVVVKYVLFNTYIGHNTMALSLFYLLLRIR